MPKQTTGYLFKRYLPQKVKMIEQIVTFVAEEQEEVQKGRHHS
jgi:hypothetical protein